MATIGFTQSVFSTVEDNGMGGDSIAVACIRVLAGEIDRPVVVTVTATDGNALGKSLN